MSIPDAIRQSDINLPEDLRWLSWVAGSAWPEGSENGMFALADAWSEASAGLTGLVSTIEDAVDDILSAYPSAGAGSAMARTLRNLTDESDQASLQAIAESLGQLADSCDQVGCAIQQNKIMIIVGLVQLVYEIALAWLFPPTAGPTQAALIGWYRIVFQYLKQLLRQMLVAALKAMGQQVILTLLIQLGQMAAGHRDGVNGKDLWFAALGGALGGAFGAMFGKLGGDLFQFLGGKITRSQFDNRFQQLMRGAVEGGAGGVGGMIGGGIANQVINGGEFELDPRMLGAGAAGAFSAGAGRWRGAGGGKVHVDPVGGPRSPAGSTPPTEVPPSASDTGAAPKSDSKSPNVDAGRGSGARQNESLSEHHSGPSASDQGGDQTNSTVSSPHRNTAEDNLPQPSSSAKSGGDDSSAPNTGRAPANHEQSETSAQQHTSETTEPAPRQHEGSRFVPQPPNAANASQQPASNATGGDKSTSSSPSAQRGADTKGVASRDNMTTAPKSDVSGDHSARAQPRAGGGLDAPESIQAKQADSTVAPKSDEVPSTPVQRRVESAQPEIDSGSPNRPDAPQVTRPIPENSTAATDKTTPVKEPAGAPNSQGRKGEKAPARDTAAAPVAEPRARAGAKGIKGVSDDLALVGRIDEATGLRWRLVETSLLDPAWPGGKAFIREVLGFEQTMQMLRGNKSPHEGREVFRPFQDGDLPMRPGFGQKKTAGADDLGEGAGGGVRGYDERNSRGVFRFNTDELPDHRYTIDKDGLWSKASAPESNGKPDSESDVIPRKGATTIEVPRQGPILQRWAEIFAPAMRTVVGDHDGNWYVGKNLHHEQFHNAGVYVAFQAQFVNGKMVAVHDWAGAYQPSPTRVKAALEKLGIYGDLDHYDQQGRKYTDADREGWTQAAEPTPASRKIVATEDDSTERHSSTRVVSDEPQRDFLREAEDITRTYQREDWENATPEDLREALRGSVHHDARDAESVAKYHRAVTAAVETIRRGTTKFDDDGAEVAPGKVLRWTQVMGTMGMREGPINMDAGEGKTFVFLADSIMKAAAGDSVHVFTTRDTLANDAVNLYKQVLGVLGPDVFHVVRMNPNGADETGLDPAKPTIYIGTLDDAAFGQLRGKFMRGDIAVIDELDEALYYADTTWIISDGPSLAADPHIASRIMAARHFLEHRLDSGDLSPADFDRTDGQIGGPAKLNAEGAEKVRRLLAEEDPGASPDDLAVQIDRVDSAASAHWEFVEDDHYIVHRGGDGVDKVYIIDQTTHKVMFDPATSTESRWNGGLAQAIEAKHGITIRGDSVSSQSLTAKTMLAERYEWLSGASGTAEGVSGHLVDNYGMKPVVTVPRFTESKLDTLEANLAPNQSAKHDAIADKLIGRHSAQARPELVITNRNSEVAEISARLTAANIPHEVVDARWFADRGPTAEADLKAIFDKAGRFGKILIINRQGGRGVDIEISDAVNAAGGLRVSISGKSDVRDIDIQAENRAARNGQQGSVEYFLAADDALFATAPHHAQTIIRYTDAVTSHENASVRLDEARATKDLAERADAVGSTVRTRTVRDAALGDYTIARDAHRAATVEREAAEAAVRAAASHLQAENAARRMGRTVLPPTAVPAGVAAHTSARDLDIPSPIHEQRADLGQQDADVSESATGSLPDDLTGTELPQLFGDDQFGRPAPLAVVDFPGLFVADTTGHLVAFGTEEMPVVRTYSHEQNLVQEIEHPVSGPVVLDSALVADLFTTRTRADGTVVVSSTATGAHVVVAGITSMLPAGSVYGRPDPLDSTKFTLYGGSNIGWLTVDANRIGVTPLRATGPLRRDDVPEAPIVNAHVPAPTVVFADPTSRVLGMRLAELADEIKASRDDAVLRDKLTAQRTAADELENHFATLPEDERTIAVARAKQLGSIDRHTAKLAESHNISLETARAEMKAELVTALAGKDIAVRISEESLLDVLRYGRFKTVFDLDDTGAGTNDRALLEARWFGHDANDHPIDKRAVYGYVRVGGEQPVGDLHDERLNVYGDAVVVLKSAVRARTTVCVGDSIEHKSNVYPSSLEDPAPESFGVYPPRRPGLPAAHVGLRRDLTHPDFRKWGYVEAQVHGGVTSADIDHVVFKWEPETALRDQLRAAGILWKVLEHTAPPIVNKPGQADPAISSGWKTYLNSARVSDDPNALHGKNFLGVAVAFTYADVVTQDLIGPAGTPIGVGYKHVASEIEGAERWAGAQQWHDRVVRTRPGQTGKDVFAGQTRVGHEVVAAPWAAEYGGVGREPIFVNAHAGPNTFEIRLRTGTTLEVSGATFAKLVEQSPALEAARAAGGPSSVVLVACEPAKGSAATDFAATLHQRFPAAPVHAAASAVWISNWRNPAVPTVRYRYLAADNNAGWVSLHSDGTRVEHAGTRYPTGATGSPITAATELTGSNSLASSSNPIVRQWKEVLDPPVKSPLTTTTAESGALVAPAVSSGWRTYLNSWRVSNDPDVLHGKNAFELPINFTYADVVAHEMFGSTGALTGVCFQNRDLELDANRRWAAATEWHDKVVRTQPGQTGEQAFHGPKRVGQEVVDAPWVAEFTRTGHRPVFVTAHAGPNTFEIRLRTGTTLEVNGTTFAKIVEWSPGLRGPLSTGAATSIVLLACKPAKGSAATKFARTLHQNFPQVPVHAAATSVWQSTMRYPARPNVDYRLLAADRNAGWVTLHSDGTRTEHASTRYSGPAPASSGVVGSESTTGGTLSAPLRFSSDQEATEVVEAVTSAEAAANDARLWKWLTRNMFDDAFDHAVRGRTLRDGSGIEELSDLEDMSEDARNPAPGAGLLADTAEVQWSDDELARLFADPDAGSTATALSPPAATAEHHPPTTETLAALPLHVAPAAEAFVRGDRCVLIDGLGTAHRLDVGSGWRAVKKTISDPGTGAEYIGLVPLDQKHDASPIRIRKTLLVEAFEENAATFFWETTYFLARAGLGIEGSGDAPVWLPPRAVVAVKHAHHPDGTLDPSRTTLGRPKAATWHTLDSDVLGPLVPELRRSNNPLWDEISGPRVSDVRQGALGNCFLAANMMALARSPLPLLREMMTDLGDSVAVRFFDKSGDASWVRVSKDLYVDGDNSTRYAADRGVLWPAVLEKAYAVFVGEFGYAGLDGGSPGATAATMLPATLPGGSRFQPSRTVTDAYFHHPMRMDIDELRGLAHSDDEFARAVCALRGEWEDRVRDHRAREANPMAADADRAQLLALVAGNGNDVWAAVREFYRLIRPDNPGSTEGFRRFLNHELSPQQRTRWASNIERLVDSVDRAASWRTRELDQQTGGHIAERVDFALRRGDLVMLGTRDWGRDDTVRFPGLAGNHGYTALGVQRDEDGRPVALRLRNPWGTNRSAQPPLPGITFQPDGVVDVELRHLNKFATLAICGPGARGLFGLDRLAPPGVDDLVGTRSEAAEPAQSADAAELLGVELPGADEGDGHAVAHVSHPIDWKKHLGVLGHLGGGKKLSGTADHTVVRFRARNLIQEPILDQQGRTVGITFLYGPDELEVLRTWGNAPNGHGMVFRTRPGEAGSAALAGDRNRIGLDRFVPAPWVAEYQEGKPGPFYISVHADSRGFEVRSRAGRSIAVDGTTFAAIVQASPTFQAAMTSGLSRSVVMIACAVANGSAGEEFSAALHQTFPDRRIYGSRGDVDVHAESGRGVGLLAAGDNAGWMSYLNAVATDHAATRYDAPATDGRAAFVERTANDTDIVDWVEQLRSTEAFFGEEPYFGVTSDDRVIGFFGADVLVNPMLDHHGDTIGVSFHQPDHLAGELLWARTENFHNVVTRMRDGDDDLSVVVQRILQEGSSRTENVRAPWALDYANGKNGPVYISAHADANLFEINLRSGVTIDVDGTTFASIVQSAHPFGAALASGLAAALETPKSFVLMACKAAAGAAGSGFAEVFGRVFPGRPVHASTGTVNFHVLRVDKEEGPPIRISWLGASHNAGWMSYRNGRQIRHDHTRHPPPHPDSTEPS